VSKEASQEGRPSKALRHQPSRHVTQGWVIAQSMPNLFPNTETKILGAHIDTANLTEYVSVGTALRLVTPSNDRYGYF
jgi:hypothetical protein